jgi:hypothetical protein
MNPMSATSAACGRVRQLPWRLEPAAAGAAAGPAGAQGAGVAADHVPGAAGRGPRRIPAAAGGAQFVDAPGPGVFTVALKGIWLAMANGFQASTSKAEVDALLSHGGMDRMLLAGCHVLREAAFAWVPRDGACEYDPRTAPLHFHSPSTYSNPG